MLVQGFLLTFVCALFCQGTLCKDLPKNHLETRKNKVVDDRTEISQNINQLSLNFSQESAKIRRKRSDQEANQSHFKGIEQNTGDGQILSNLINQSLRNDKSDVYRSDDVFRPAAQNVPKPFNIKKTSSPSTPLPVQLLYIEDDKRNEPNSELNTSQNGKPRHVGEEIIDSESTIAKKRKQKQKPSTKNVKKNMNDGEVNIPLASKTYQNITDINQKRHHTLILENRIKNRTNNGDYGSRINNSTEVLNSDEITEKAVLYLLNILGNSHDSKGLDSTNSRNTKSQEEMNMDIHHKKLHNSDNGITQSSRTVNESDMNLENLRNINFTVLEKVSQLLQEQNSLLKEILFKALNRNNQTNSDESAIKKIHLILDLDNLQSKRYEIPVNFEAGRNDSENVLDEVIQYNKNDADTNINSGQWSKNQNTDFNVKSQQYPQQHILNSYSTGNYPYPYYVNPVNKYPTYLKQEKNYAYKPNINPSITSNPQNQINYVVPDESENAIIYEAKNFNPANDGVLNNNFKYDNPKKSQSRGIFYYTDPKLTVSKYPFHGNYYSRQ